MTPFLAKLLSLGLAALVVLSTVLVKDFPVAVNMLYGIAGALAGSQFIRSVGDVPKSLLDELSK